MIDGSASTWLASSLCAIGIVIIAVSALNRTRHFLFDDPFFLPLYAAGILQWLVWGWRLADHALIWPSLVQLIVLAPFLRKWYARRMIA